LLLENDTDGPGTDGPGTDGPDSDRPTGEPDGGADEGERSRVAVPWPAVVAIGICVAVTVVFGIIPAPLVDFAHKATLLFLP
jgi:hypothetical protein